jgi:hypothetical protein
LVQRLTTRWVEDNHTPEGIALHMAVARTYGLDFAPAAARLRQAKQHITNAYDSPDARLARAQQLAANPATEASVRAMARVSQAAHPADADGMVTLYRGVGNSRANADGSHTFGTDPMTSFTASPDVARRFAREYGGHVVAVRVPRSAIVASYRAVPAMRGRAAHNEQEVLVASRGSFTGTVVPPGAR